jgi:hypothetical protein
VACLAAALAHRSRNPRHSASRLPEVRGRACDQAAGASCSSGPLLLLLEPLSCEHRPTLGFALRWRLRCACVGGSIQYEVRRFALARKLASEEEEAQLGNACSRW